MRIFVDSSIILAFLAGQDQRAYSIIKEIENRTITGYINAIVIDEVIYGYLRLTTGLSSKRIRQLLSKKNNKIIELIENDIEPVLDLFIILPIIVESREIIELMKKYGLMPADSIIVSTCKRYQLDKIASLDTDFRRVEWLEVIP